MSDPRNASDDVAKLIHKRISTLRAQSMHILRLNMAHYRLDAQDNSLTDVSQTLKPVEQELLEQDLLEITFRMDELYRLLRTIADESRTSQDTVD